MKSEKLLTLLMTIVLFFSFQLTFVRAQNNEVTEQNYSLAEKHFGWNPDVIVNSEDISILAITIDEKYYFLVGNTAGSGNETMFRNPSNGKLMLTLYPRDNRLSLSSYFSKEQKIGPASDLLLQTFFSLTSSESIPEVENIISKEKITLEELASALLAVDIEKYDSTWYYEPNLPSLDKLEYKNTVPSINDSTLFEKEQLIIFVQYPTKKISYKEQLDSTKFFMAREITREGKIYCVEVFTDEEIFMLNEKKSLDFLDNNLDLNRPEMKGLGSIKIYDYNVDFVPILRECIEEMDGKEYYNVGKLRKLYEAFEPNHRPDYSIYMNK